MKTSILELLTLAKSVIRSEKTVDQLCSLILSFSPTARSAAWVDIHLVPWKFPLWKFCRAKALRAPRSKHPGLRKSDVRTCESL
jgi:hypothetical protein